MKPERSRLPVEVKKEIAKLRLEGDTYALIAHKVNKPYSTVFDFLSTEEGADMLDGLGTMGSLPNILFFDVEVMASLVLAFPRFQANICPEAVIEEPYMLTYAGAWGDGEVFSRKLTDSPDWEFDPKSDFELICSVWELLDKADIVIAHNAKFDKGWFNQRCAIWGLSPPSPYKLICTLREVRKAFNLPANSLKAVTKYFELTNKLDSGGMDTWVRIYNGDRSAFDDMEEYNIGDIPTLRQVYKTVLPFMTSHPNVALYYSDDKPRCYKCGSSEVFDTGKFTYTGVSKFELTKCEDCGSFNSRKSNVLEKDKKSSLHRSTI